MRFFSCVCIIKRVRGQSDVKFILFFSYIESKNSRNMLEWRRDLVMAEFAFNENQNWGRCVLKKELFHFILFFCMESASLIKLQKSFDLIFSNKISRWSQFYSDFDLTKFHVWPTREVTFISNFTSMFKLFECDSSERLEIQVWKIKISFDFKVGNWNSIELNQTILLLKPRITSPQNWLEFPILLSIRSRDYFYNTCHRPTLSIQTHNSL